MMDENYVSKEVNALLERMEQFPHEFVNGGHWASVFRETFATGRSTELGFALTAEEYRLLKETYRKISREAFHEHVVTSIINPKQEEFVFGDTTNSSDYYKKLAYERDIQAYKQQRKMYNNPLDLFKFKCNW